MQAIVMTAIGGPDVLEVREVPEPRPQSGEVLIRTDAIPVLFPETMLRSGAFPLPAQAPLVFGTQAVGVITAVGSEVDAALLGRRVLASSDTFGTYAEWVCAPAASVTLIPEELSSVDAAAVGMSASVALSLVARAQLTGTETVLVEAAATGVGGYLTQLAQQNGAARVIATAGGPVKADRARELGADVVIDHTDPQWSDTLREILEGATVDVVFDSIGGDSAQQLLDIITPVDGRMLSYGWLSGAPAQLTAMDLILRGITLTGCAGPAWLSGVAQSRGAALERAATGSIIPLTDRVMPLDQAAAAHQLVADRVPVGTIVLRP